MKRIISIIVIFFFVSNVFGQVNVDPKNAAKIKSIFIYNFTRYFTWKNLDKVREFKIGVLGEDSLMKKELKRMVALKSFGNLPMRIISFSSIEEIKPTEMLYVNYLNFPEFKLKNTYKNTLVISENNPDLNNAMIAFVTKENRQKFAINTFNISSAGLEINEEIKSLAIVFSGNNKTLDEQMVRDWKSVFDKFNEALKNNSSSVTLSKNDAAEVLASMEADKATIKENSKLLNDQISELRNLGNKLSDREIQIKTQERNLIAQKDKIDEQLKSILTQEQRLKLQEQKLEITILENKVQQANLDLAKQQVSLQQAKMNNQKSILKRAAGNPLLT